MRYENTTPVGAEPARVWEMLSDVERWPERIATYEEVRLHESGALRVGSRAHVKQKGLAAGEWEVTELTDGTSFTWTNRHPGVRSLGRHTGHHGRARVDPADADAGDVRLAGRRGRRAARAQGPRVRRPRGGVVEGRGRVRVSQTVATGRDALLERAIGHFAVHGIGDTSLRGLAEAIGTSHRMLIYHFGSREGLLAAVVDVVEQGARDTLATMVEEARSDPDPVDAGLRYWRLVTDEALVYGPLFFELSSHAMLGLPHAVDLRSRLVSTWLEALTSMWKARGVPTREARMQARLDLAVARGLLHDLLLTGERRAVDAAMRRYARSAVDALLG